MLHSAEMHQDTWPSPPPPSHPLSPLPLGLHEILPLYSLATDPTDALGPSYTSREEGDVGVCYPGLQSIRCGHGQWTRASSSLDSGRQEDRSRGPSAALKQPTQIYCTTANHHGSTRRDQDSRERSRIRDPSQTRGVPPNQPPTLQQNLLGRRSFGAEACPGDRCSCRWVARTAGWGPVEDHFLDTVADDTETSAAGARLRC